MNALAWSLTNYTGEEIVNLAVAIEKEGKEFYDSALAYAKGYKLKEALVYLAREEQKHIAVFQKIGDKLVKSFTPNESYEGEYEDYLKSIVNSAASTPPSWDMVKNLHTDKDILNFRAVLRKGLHS
jgi:rubrerythrin